MGLGRARQHPPQIRGRRNEGIDLTSTGANGGNGSTSVGIVGDGGDGGSGGSSTGLILSVTGGDQRIVTSGSNAEGILVQGFGGRGGNGGERFPASVACRVFPPHLTDWFPAH